MYMIYDMIYVDRYASHYAYTKYFWVMMKFFFGMHIQQVCFRTFSGATKPGAGGGTKLDSTKTGPGNSVQGALSFVSCFVDGGVV